MATLRRKDRRRIPRNSTKTPTTALLSKVLKYGPAVLLGLMLIEWLPSTKRSIGFTINRGSYQYYVASAEASLVFGRQNPMFQMSEIVWSQREGDWHMSLLMGRPGFVGNWKRGYEFGCPHVILMTAVLPLAIGAISSFRFRLWQYFVYMAIIAAELAFYLRPDVLTSNT